MDIARTPPKRTRRTALIGAGVVGVAVLTAVLMRLDPAVPSIERAAVLIDTVRRGDVVREVRGPGTLVPERIRFITAQASARVERVNTESGQTVQPNAVLLELSNPDLQIQTMQAEQQARQADADLITLATSLRSQVLTQQGTVATTRTLYVSAMQESAAADSLVQRNLISTFEKNNKRAQAEELTTRLRVEQERLALLSAAIDSQIGAQRARVSQLRAIAASQQARLASLSVRAPEGGVLQDLSLQLGQWVPEGTTLAKVVQPGRLKAVLRIPESQAKDVQIGQRASIDTRNGLVAGRVIRKDPSALGGAVTVDVALEGTLPAGAVPDLTVDGTITIETLKNVLYTGRPAQSAGAGSVSLFKVVDGGAAATRVAVDLGRSSVNMIEILRGLEVGEQVIVSDMTPYAASPRIRIR
ncbi:MAG: HlyD family efflux transporter periplasmic adaptor subunit [Gemmatimonadaceae bacterium]|jgi:multidrug efflux pump subunit AcrA (membrane-fusion protein)|nr:HlyD family efflux transporter periplasmic adaptor subunit [Gemmatimonadaceae bacterium]